MTDKNILTCRACKEEVKKGATKCPHCGENNPIQTKAKGCLGAIVFIFIIAAVLATCTDNSKPTSTTSPAPEASQNWYDGGGLQTENALVWQKASYQQKLATAADIYAHFYQNNNLAPAISSTIKGVDDLKPYAESLVLNIDEAYSAASTVEENEKMYSNQKVAETAVLLLTMQGHLAN
ncbi:hypothetical protein AB4259_19560 [Vibrio amylolyticus]|uniref:hypothetical protein n=1 Tax=Vibrio amylolyticus TaxID=2847292 RepID=UPI0035527D5C